ncbi:iron uptake transporter deferrochelatase/peroxidase subunit [Rhodococcus aerolatus]
MSPALSRRGFLGLAGAGAAVAGAGVVAGRASEPSVVPAAATTVAFRGAHQAGIATPVQDRLHFVAFDVVTSDRAELVDLLARWTEAAERMTRGAEAEPDGATGAGEHRPPTDTGEALDLGAASLTLTIGFGPSLFRTAEGVDRFGIADRAPAALVDLPRFSRDALDPARCGGDLAVQACADDPQVAVHAIRNLARMGVGVVAVRWSQLGFGRTSSTSTAQRTPRNMFGFKDGTANLVAEDPALLDEHVWVGADDDPAAGWLAGGSYLVARRIRMLIEPWDRASLHEQEQVVGRHKGSGAPLGGTEEHAALPLGTMTSSGPLIPEDAHVRLASPQANGGAQMLRRGYTFTDGTDGLGHLDAGLFFLAFVRDPAVQYVPVQARLSRSDAMAEYLQHTGSALFACPPGLRPGESWGSTLLT